MASLRAFAAGEPPGVPAGAPPPGSAAPRPATAAPGLPPAPAGDQAAVPGLGASSPKPARAIVANVEPAEVVRGAGVIVSGSGFPPSPDQIEIRLDDHRIVPREVDPNGTWLTFVVPAKRTERDRGGSGRDRREAKQGLLRLGIHRLSVLVKSGGPASWVPARGRAHQLRLVPDTEGPPELSATYPAVTYPESRYQLSVMGSGFSREPSDNIPVVDGRELAVCEHLDCSSCTGEVCVKVVSSRQLEISGMPKDGLSGPRDLRIRVGDDVSNPIRVTFSGVAQNVPLWAAALFVLVCVVLIAMAVAAAGKVTLPSGDTLGSWGTLFLDKETQSYSVGKLQLYLWWFAAIFGYVYLTAARSLVQGNLDLAPIPDRLPGIVMISSATSVLAIGITNVRGPKGAGDIKPSLSDFITVGGLVAAERVQFLVWTLVGVTSFLLLVVLRDPAEIQDLPQIPEGFLYLMGISSFGYLGGKLVRGAGPVIDLADVIDVDEKAQPFRLAELHIRGRNLSRDASVRFHGGFARLVTGTRPEVIEKEDRPPEGEYARILSLKIEITNASWPAGSYELTLSNPDGQEAVSRVVARPTA
ncbi:hypothetical protein [Sorangium sp. So ce1153]|uniref:hypothetical protein n=1 Tax=Sorangium sp. So ce1153 TaxID=3133333 RepID=UPI003F603743